MNAAEFTLQLSERLKISKTKVGNLVDETVSLITEQLVESNVISVQNFGTFELKKREERVSVNPATGIRMLIPPKLVVGYKPSPSLKDKIKEN